MASTLPKGDTEGPEEVPARSHSPVACLVVALTACRPDDPPSRHWLAGVEEVAVGRAKEPPRHSRQAARSRLRLRLQDPQVSGRHAVLHHRGGQWVITDQQSRNGTKVNGAPISQATLAEGDLIAVGGTFLVFRTVRTSRPPEPLDLNASEQAELPVGMRTLSPRLEASLAVLDRIARSAAPIVVLGETGTGKELTARAIHLRSRRSAAPFIAVNCGALPAALLEGELFGHEKGAFTGADQRRDGLIAAADKGTLFLDEIGELPLAAQAALLRTLQSGEVRRLGAQRASQVDLRIVAATHRDLRAAVRQGTFREDLWMRLKGLVIDLPPLRERTEDLGLLVGERLRDRRLTTAAAASLFEHPWPGNIRELHGAIERALALCDGDEIGVAHLPDLAAPATRAAPTPDLRQQLDALLRIHAGNVSEVARALGKKRQQVQRWCKKLGIEVAAFREARSGSAR